MSKIKTINTSDFQIEKEDKKSSYQEKLTPKLDSLNTDFNQNIINEIVLWKVNRYAELPTSTLNLLNNLPLEFDEAEVKKLLYALLKNQKGVRLPMASTILRFKNPEIFQIIDQRVYRIIYGTSLKLSTSTSDRMINEQIDLYFKYLKDLRKISKNLMIPFNESDRILYNADKRINKGIKLKNY